jgi:hypothetical protein
VGNHLIHNRRKPRDSARPQVVAVRKASGQENKIAAFEVLVLMPEFYDILVQHLAQAVHQVFITVASGENDNAEFHGLSDLRQN